MSWITGGQNLSIENPSCDDNFVWSVQSKLLCETARINIISPPALVIRWTAIILGLPLHILVAAVILRTRQLHNPRNTFWLGAIACHTATLLMGIYEILTTIYGTIKDDVFCRIYSLLVGSPYTSLLVNLLLATADRWIAISYPLYHRKHVTVFKVILFLIASWILVLITLTSPYWSGKVQLPICSVHPDVMVWVTLSHFAVVVLIIVAQVLIYLRARQYFKFRAHHSNLKTENRQSGSSVSSSLRRDEYFVHLPDKTISRLELEASVTLWCGVAMLCFFSLPLAFLFLTAFACRLADKMKCDGIVALIPYSRELLLWHSVISPLLYILRSREFSSALRRVFPCCCSWLRKPKQPRPTQL